VIDGLRVPVKMTSRESLRMFDLADIWATRRGEHVRLVSANDHVHSRRSAHYDGMALDFQSSDPDGLSTTFKLAGYRVLWKVPGHFGHVHVEQYEATAPESPSRFASRPLTASPRARFRGGAPVSLDRAPVLTADSRRLSPGSDLAAGRER
jgi:hypothetical protein